MWTRFWTGISRVQASAWIGTLLFLALWACGGGGGSSPAPTPVNPPVIQSFSASPSTITAGDSSTLAWSVSGATALSLDPGGDVTGKTSQSVTPATTTSYRLAASNSGGSVNSTVTVTVNPLPKPTISSFTATPSTITAGDSSTLSWSVTGATSLSLDQGIGNVTGPNWVVSPSASTTYTLTATNAAGNVTASTTVTVNPLPQWPVIHSFTASPTTITAGQNSMLGWSVSNATALLIMPGVVSVTGSTSVSVNPTETTLYTLNATNQVGSVNASTTVTVNPAPKPVIQSFTANPSSITAGQSSTLSWSVSGATSLSLDQGIGTVTDSSRSVTPSTTTTYILTATNAAGSVTAGTTVTVSSSGLLPRLSLGDFQYLGAFRTPFGQYGSGKIAYHPQGNNGQGSLFLDGGESNSFSVGEISIPDLNSATDISQLSSLNTAAILQAPSDIYARIPLKGSTWPTGSVNVWDNGNQAVFGGFHVHGGKLYFNAYTYFDAGGQETATTGRIESPQNLAASAISGMWKLQGAAHVSGWLAPIPTEWQTRLGGSHLAGHDNTPPIVSRCSAGPSLFTFNLSDLATAANGSQISTQARMDFNLQNSIWGTDMANVSGNNKTWNIMTWAGHGFIAPGTRTYVLLGTSGGHNPNPANPWQGTEELAFVPPIAGTIVYKRPDSMGFTWGGTMIWDAQDRHYMYAFFDMEEILAAKNPWEPKPYANGVFPGPFARYPHYTVPGQLRDTIGGASWDEEGKRLFLSIPSADNSQDPLYAGNPVIAVYRLGGSTPLAPSISTHPQNASVQEGTNATFNLNATGTAPLSYRWQKNGSDVSGAASINTLTLNAVTMADNGAKIRCIVSNTVGSTTSNEATLTVTQAPQKPVISSFTANPSTITAGNSSTLSWMVSGANSLSLDPEIGTVTGTSRSVSPSTTTTYTLTATNTAGSVTASTTITVDPPPQWPVIHSFTANPTTITAGQTSTLSWNVSNATVLLITPGVGTVTGTTSVSVNPMETTLYTLNATNQVGSVNATATITVNPASKPVIQSFTANPATITAGQSSTLSWSVTGHTSLSLDQGIGTVTGTSRSVSPNITTTYTLTATNSAGSVTAQTTVIVQASGAIRIILLHHSTGGVIWEGGIPDRLASYNSSHGTNYLISERAYPDEPYPWDNYPYDYWNLWVNPSGPSNSTQPGVHNLETLVANYDVIVFKHCFPVSHVEADTGNPSVSSATRSQENYKLQYEALKTRLRSFSSKKFLLWTGAALLQSETSQSEAERARDFFTWAKSTWDEKGDNIFIWDFRELETEGGLYLPTTYSAGDSHPNAAFAQTVAPYFVNRLVNVIEGRGDTTRLDGKDETGSYPVISHFTASPTIITAGQSSTLSWSVTGHTSLSLNQGIGTVTGASRSVNPIITTTYTLTATNAAGNSTANTTVTVQGQPGAALVIDHTCTDLSKIPTAWLTAAKQNLRIGYSHTSHGSQLVTGLFALRGSSGDPTYFDENTQYSGWGLEAGRWFNDYWANEYATDLSHNGDLGWRNATETMLAQSGNDRNVVIWSWCGGVSDNDSAGIQAYLSAMDALEKKYPSVKFIYMTGHLDGSGSSGNLHLRNEQIRTYCRANGKTLFDFADIESFDPDGQVNYMNLGADDGCNYGSGQNWATAWIAAHPSHPLTLVAQNCDECAHSERLNCVMKGRAFWWLLARLAGWNGVATQGQNP